MFFLIIGQSTVELPMACSTFCGQTRRAVVDEKPSLIFCSIRWVKGPVLLTAVRAESRPPTEYFRHIIKVPAARRRHRREQNWPLRLAALGGWGLPSTP